MSSRSCYKPTVSHELSLSGRLPFLPSITVMNAQLASIILIEGGDSPLSSTNRNDMQMGQTLGYSLMIYMADNLDTSISNARDADCKSHDNT